MCGVLGFVANEAVNQILYDGLQMLQHRGQDAAGIVTLTGNRFHMHKGKGMVREVFRTRNMRELVGNAGIAHVRYPTAGNAGSSAESQPFYVSSPFGIVLAHNGNLTNTEELYDSVYKTYLRHVNTQSDSEVLLNVFAHELRQQVTQSPTPHQLSVASIFQAVTELHKRVRGAYGVVAMIAGYGMLAFRDPNGIRPLVLGKRENADGTVDYAVASENIAFTCVDGFEIVRDLDAGEAVFITLDGQFFSQHCAENAKLSPCLFEFVYFARPDSVVDGISIYQARANMGITLAEKVKQHINLDDIDVVMTIPDSSRPSAMELAKHLNKPYREGLIKNRYIGRTFIMPGQATRKKSVRQKLSPIPSEFAGKNVLLVDDSIVRGTTSREIVDMVRAAGAKKVFFASAAPEVRYPNVYGIDMPTREELIANGRSPSQIAQEINADLCIFQDLSDLENVIRELNPKIQGFDSSCFSGCYITGDVDEDYLNELSASKKRILAEKYHPTLINHNVSINDNEDAA
ncbi:amidophosphoribosyltransferase [Alysiella filiformis]|uniref:Amidophosphoribosyltransferase n=1 Tax=Alysiella filiformis DSM 16848 TaxID=1120981 RepID=A0A286EC43_9NEIS|nr:amidophosphoribosyltransferase [Alysiella filiformis]QMT30613.1 amidophosphoribosyltransferase [Alysiella filiformis]UBQ56409.1 amidophosphoribosyltransferase [Alysiella filiformis DSM 16848]SOD68497.1 amidophosphoribosyltransferase [Alysiella filiformis DSM 16848]